MTSASSNGTKTVSNSGGIDDGKFEESVQFLNNLDIVNQWTTWLRNLNFWRKEIGLPYFQT